MVSPTNTSTGLNGIDDLCRTCAFLRFLCCLLFFYFFNGRSPMHPRFSKADGLTGTIIAAGIEVHRARGPGLLESIYEWALIKEIELRGLRASSEQRVRVEYKGFIREEPLRYDVLVEDCLLVEVKAVEAVHPIHKAQLLSYMRLLDVPLGLILNFHQEKLVDGVSRLILPSANR